MVSRTAEQHVSVPLLRAAWETLAFVHWRVAPEQVQPLLPEGLTVDTYDGDAWVGLVPFVMADIRPLGVRVLPSRMARSPETNLRTYVRGPDGRDGVWFLSLDIGSGALAGVLRGAVGAPYQKGHLTVEHRGDSVVYAGKRGGGGPSYRLRVRPGEPIAPTELETWLTGRWRAYTLHLGRLLATPLEHEPWQLRRARLQELGQDLTAAAGIGGLSEPLVHYTDRVGHVRVGRPRLLPR